MQDKGDAKRRSEPIFVDSEDEHAAPVPSGQTRPQKVQAPRSGQRDNALERTVTNGLRANHLKTLTADNEKLKRDNKRLKNENKETLEKLATFRKGDGELQVENKFLLGQSLHSSNTGQIVGLDKKGGNGKR